MPKAAEIMGAKLGWTARERKRQEDEALAFIGQFGGPVPRLVGPLRWVVELGEATVAVDGLLPPIVTAEDLAKGGALKELVAERRRLDIQGKKLAVEALRKQRGQQSEVIDGYTKRGGKVVKKPGTSPPHCPPWRGGGRMAAARMLGVVQ